MDIRRYQQGSTIDEIVFEKTESGAVRAYLHANSAIDSEKLANISKNLSAHDWQNIPSTHNGKAMLEVRGFGSEKKLLEEMTQQGWVKGTAQIEKTKEKPVSFTNKIKKNSLQASGLFFLVGDAAYAAYGYKKGHKEDMLAGAMYFLGSAALLGYGNHDNSHIEIHNLAKKMQDEMKKQSVNLPENCSLAAITRDHKHGLLKSADDLLSRYPSEIMNGFFGLAGASIAASALRHNIYAKPPAGWDKEQVARKVKEGKMDVGLGAMTMASGALASMIQEKAHDPDAPKKHGTAAIWEWIQERPLAIAGVGYIISTCFHAVSSYHSMKSAKINNDEIMKKSIPMRATFVGANLIAETLMTISSKGHGKGVVSDKSVDDSIVALTAELIATQPAAQQNHLIDYMSGFLGRNDVLAMKNDEVKDLLRTQVELVKKNPWAHCLKTASAPAAASGASMPIIPPHDTNWQMAVKSPLQTTSPATFI